MLAIKNAIIVMTDHYIPDGVILIEDGKIMVTIINDQQEKMKVFELFQEKM